MKKTRPSVIGQGPELFGRGIDLLFGEADDTVAAQPADSLGLQAPAPRETLTGGSTRLSQQPGVDALAGEDTASHSQNTAEASGMDAASSSGARPGRSQETTMKPHRTHKKAAAGANGAASKTGASPASRQASGPAAELMQDDSAVDLSVEPLPLELGGEPAQPLPLELGGEPAQPLPLELGGEPAQPLPLELGGEPSQPLPLELGGEPSQPLPLELGGPASPAVAPETESGTVDTSPMSDLDQAESVHTVTDAAGDSTLSPAAPADSQPTAPEESSMSDQPKPTSDVEATAHSSGDGSGKRRVAPPGVPVSGPPGVKPSTGDSELSGRLSKQALDALSKEDVREIMKRLHKGDLAALDKEVDALYDKVSTLLSGNRREATVAFEILRKVRLMLLKDPEQFAQAEYLLRQVRARVNQIEQSIQAGTRNAPRLFAYETIWMVVLSIFALVTTVGGTTFTAWIGYFLGVTPDSERLNWAVLFLSTLAWGGIGGVTCALWSLYYHISVQRDYDPIENLWYYSQPVLGMVLGGIVFLIMGAGFLIVQVDLSGTDAALGARLLPAAIAVIAGFRQTVVLDLIERAIALITPPKAEEATLPTPPSEPI